MSSLSAGILITNGVSVLLARRNNSLNTFPGYWSPFAGAVEEGETPKEAAIRELFEESKILPDGKLSLIKKVSRASDSDFYLYLLTVKGKIPYPVLDFEHTEWGIFQIDSIDVTPTPMDPHVVSAIKSIQKNPKP